MIRRPPAPRTVARPALVFGGIPEAEGWSSAPLRARDRVHFRTNLALPLADLRADLPAGAAASLDDGQSLYRVDGACGSGDALAEFVKEWCHRHGLQTIGLRPETNVRRRNLDALAPAYLGDLCLHYGPYSLKVLQRSMTTIRLHIPESDDVQQRVAEWILEAATRYDATIGVPFGAFLAERLARWVHELGRTAFGRTAVDAELRQQRAIAAYQQTNRTHPNDAELAALLGQSLTTVRRNTQTIAVLSGLRNIGSLDRDSEIRLPYVTDATDATDEIMSDVQQSLLSHALTTSCAPDPTAGGRAGQANVLGWVTWYATTWAGLTKTELSQSLGTSMRNINVHGERAGARMRTRLAERLDG